MAKALKPGRENRDACLAALWKRLDLAAASQRSGAAQAMLDDDLQRGRAPQAGLMAVRVTNGPLDRWLLARWAGNRAADGEIVRAFACVYWGAQLVVTNRQVAGWGDDVAEDILYDLLAWQGLAAAGAEAAFADWAAAHLHNLFASGGVEKTARFFAVDQAALKFTEALQLVLLTAKWPAASDVAAMGPYAALFTAAPRPADFRSALVDYCDYRTAECFGYHGIDATVKRRPSADESIMDRGSWEQVYPVELLTLRHAFKKATGQDLSLDAPHPLLQTPLMTMAMPALTPLHDDALTKSLVRLGQSAFGAQWRPGEPVRARFV